MTTDRIGHFILRSSTFLFVFFPANVLHVWLVKGFLETYLLFGNESLSLSSQMINLYDSLSTQVRCSHFLSLIPCDIRDATDFASHTSQKKLGKH